LTQEVEGLMTAWTSSAVELQDGYCPLGRGVRTTMPLVRSAWQETCALVAVTLLLAACTSQNACAPIPPSADCPDITFGGVGYNELREYHGPPPTQLQEVGDATYPACNVAQGCPGSEFEGFGATDLWLLEGADTADAVIGVRENSDTLVIFVRLGVEPGDLPLPSDHR
jgi:hypothetical protein